MPIRHPRLLAGGVALLALAGGGCAAFLFVPIDIPPLPLELAYTPGSATLVPNELIARSTGNHLTLTVTLGPEPVAVGGHIDALFGAQVVDLGAGPRLYAPQLISWAPFQARNPEEPSYVSLEPLSGPSQVELAIATNMARNRRVIRLLRGKPSGVQDYSTKELVSSLMRIPAVVKGAPLPGGSTLVFHLGGPAGQGVGIPGSPRETLIQVAVMVDAQGRGDFKLLEHIPSLRVVGGPAKEVRVVAPSVVKPGEPFQAVVQAVDEFGDPDVHFEGSISVKARGQSAVYTVPLTAADRGEQRLTVPGLTGAIAGSEAGPEAGWLEVSGQATGQATGADRAGGTSLTGSSQPFLIRADGPRLYWGDTHRHSVLADGFLVPAEIYRRAAEEEHLDWVCLSEHSHPDPFDLFGSYRRRLTLSPSEWAYLGKLADQYDNLEHFSALMGYEWSSGSGHRNVYFHPSESAEPLLSNLTPTGELGVADFLRTFEGRKVIIIPHHPGWRLHNAPFDWGPPEKVDALQRLVEVYSQHGNSEFHDNPRAIHAGPGVRLPKSRIVRFFLGERVLGPRDQSPEGSPGFVRTALGDGRRMGLMASSDNHFMDNGDISYRGGLTAVWSVENDRGGLWNGLHDRSVFGTSGARMVIDFHVSGLSVGQEGKAGGSPQLSGQVLGTGPLKRVEILRHDRNGYGYALTKDVSEARLEFQFSDNAFAGPGFYYLRVEQRDGELGWAGPIWLD